jgi:multidrug efflux pump subunit AcrB
MPVALFPNATKPDIGVNIPYDQTNRQNFIDYEGKNLESLFSNISVKSCDIEEVTARYALGNVHYRILGSWGNDAQVCLREVNSILNFYKTKHSKFLNKQTYSYTNSKGSGFYLASFYSSSYNTEEIYDEINKVIIPKINALKNTDIVNLYNPDHKIIKILLDPYQLNRFNLTPEKITNQIQKNIRREYLTKIKQHGEDIHLEFKGNINEWQDLKKLLINTGSGAQIRLDKIAKTELYSPKNNQIFKLDGETSIILHITGKPGANIKSLCDNINKIIKSTFEEGLVTNKVKYVVNVNPGNFINEAINNVLNEVILCSIIAVIILFIFIGSFSGTMTAMIEIPASILLSFILLKLTNIQINLISLGGLALSVGMNVDASIVVIEVVMKELSKMQRNASYTEISNNVIAAVRGVSVPLVLSTITSLIVFIPLYFTFDITFAILGDLSLAVVYSHTLSLFIALILVPTIRLHMVKAFGLPNTIHPIPRISNNLNKLYAAYCKSLLVFISHRNLFKITSTIIMISIIFASVFIIKALPKKIMDEPATNIIGVSINYPKSKSVKEIESVVGVFEKKAKKIFPKEIYSTFSNLYQKNNAFFAIFLHNKNDFKKVFDYLQEITKSTAEVHYQLFPWYPSSMPLPDPKDWKIRFYGKDKFNISKAINYFYYELRDNDFDSINARGAKDYLKKPNNKYLFNIKKNISNNKEIYQYISDYISLSNKEIYIAQINSEDKQRNVVLGFPEYAQNNIDTILNLPVRIKKYFVPLRALVDISEDNAGESRIFRKNREYEYSLSGRFTEKEKENEYLLLDKLKNLFTNFQLDILPNITDGVTISMVDTKIELTKAMYNLGLAISLSLLMMFLVLYLRFSSIVQVLIIMSAIPFGYLGALLSLYIFNSSISLNSILGIILLNGISVANSILLVEMIVRLHKQGKNIKDAILVTAMERIRPILITSLTTILGMAPIAYGYGEGGKVLQPLGIAVCGGLWVSLIFTLYIVPACMYKFGVITETNKFKY